MEETKYIIASHGSLARGFYTAIEMIIGSCENVKDYNLDEFDSPYQILEELEAEVSSNQNTQYVVFTDLLGGTVAIQSVLDSILPYMLPVGLTLLMFKYLRKDVSPTLLIGILIVVSMILSFFKIM